jgi:thioesterase domain-containing protein
MSMSGISAPPVPIASTISQLYRATPVQAGLLYQSLAAPGAGLYVEQFLYQLPEDLNTAWLLRAWRETVHRHEILRSGVIWEQRDWPVVFVKKQVHVSIKEEDWSGKSSEIARQDLIDFLESDRTMGFDLRSVPVMRLSLLRQDGGHTLVWSFHHILMDGWSVSLVIADVLQLYEAYRSESEVTLPPAPAFSNYVKWLQERPREDGRTFWKRQMEGVSSPTRLPMERKTRSRMSGGEGVYEEIHVEIPVGTTEALHAFARRLRITVNTLIEASWALVLKHTHEEEQVIYGVTVAGRPPELPHVETIVGPFINTLPVRVDISDLMIVWKWLQQLQQTHIDMQPFEYSSLSDIRGWSELSTSRLFDSIVVFENYPDNAEIRARNGGAAVSLEPQGMHERTKYPATLIARKRDSKLSLQGIFRHDWFTRAQGRSLLASWIRMMRRLTRTSEAETMAALIDSSTTVRRPEPSVSAGTDKVEYQHSEPSTDTEKRLLPVVQRLAGAEIIGVEDELDIFEHHSLLAVRLLRDVQECFGVMLSFADLMETTTLTSLAKKIDHSGVAKPPRSLRSGALVCIQSGTANGMPPLFLIHPIGGGISFYASLARAMKTNRAIYAVESGDLIDESDSTTFHSMEQLAEAYAALITDVYPKGPYILGGWSFGGIAAFEMAHVLSAMGKRVELVALLDTYPPGEKHPHLTNTEIAVVLAREAAAQSGKPEDAFSLDLDGQSEKEQLLKILSGMRQHQLIAPETDLATMERYIAGYRNRFTLVLEYKPRRYSGPVALFKAGKYDAEFMEVLKRQAESNGGIGNILSDRSYGWDQFTDHPVEVIEVPGTHGTLLAGDSLEHTAERLAEIIDLSESI